MLKNGRLICGDALLRFGELGTLKFSTKLSQQTLSKAIAEIVTSSQHFHQLQNTLSESKVFSSPRKLTILAAMLCASL